MGWLSKAWKGIKKAVKKTAKRIKNIAKKVVTSLPGGKKLWKLGGKIGTKILKGVGKVVNKLGPVGMIALSVLAPYAAPLWSAFGAASAAAGGVMGSIGSAIYTAGNWVAGTLGSMSQGISKAIGTIAEGGLSGIMEGSLSKAAGEAVNGFASAFSGEAGKAAVEAGVASATDFAIKEAAGQSLFDQTVGKMAEDVGGALGFDNSQITLSEAGATPVDAAGNPMASQGPEPFQIEAVNDPQIAAGPTSAAADQSTFATKLDDATRLGGSTGIKSDIVKSTVSGTKTPGEKLQDGAKDLAEAMLKQNSGGIQPIQAIGDVGGNRFGGNAQGQGGVGAGGGNFLSQQMLAAMQAQTQRMTRGFG